MDWQNDYPCFADVRNRSHFSSQVPELRQSFIFEVEPDPSYSEPKPAYSPRTELLHSHLHKWHLDIDRIRLEAESLLQCDTCPNEPIYASSDQPFNSQNTAASTSAPLASLSNSTGNSAQPPVHPSRIDLVLFDDNAVAYIDNVRFAKVTNSDLKPKQWFYLHLLATQNGVFQSSKFRQRNHAFDNNSMHVIKQNVNSTPDAVKKSFQRLRKALMKYLNLSEDPIRKDRDGPYKSLFKSMSINPCPTNT